MLPPQIKPSVTAAGVSGSKWSSCTRVLQVSDSPAIAAWCSAVNPFWNKVETTTVHTDCATQCTANQPNKVHQTPSIRNVVSEPKSQHREFDGQDSLLVQRSIEMVSNPDNIWTATVCGSLKQSCYYRTRNKGGAAGSQTQGLWLTVFCH